MPRRVEDIVPNGKRSVRDIPTKKEISRSKSRKHDDEMKVRVHKVEPEEAIEEESDNIVEIGERPETIEVFKHPHAEHHPKPVKHHKKSHLGRNIFICFLIFIALAGAGYFFSDSFSRAIFTLSPRIVPVKVDGTYTAVATPANGALVYEIVKLTGSASTTVSASDGAATETKAAGSLTLYNSHTSDPWRLIAGTRLRTGDKIYRLTSSVVIPGYTTGSGSKVVPGKLNVNVVADAAGSKYNLSKDEDTTFVVVAYEGNSKYDTVYGKMNSDISGGFVGNKKTVDQNVLNATQLDLQAKITSRLTSEIKDSSSAEYVIYDQAFISTFSDPKIADSGKGSALVTVDGTVYGVLFKKNNLVQKIAGETAVNSFGGRAFESQGLENLALTISNAKDFSPARKTTLIMKLKGDINLVGVVPIEDLKEKFAGITLAETQEIMQGMSSVIDLEKSSGQVVPPWSKIPVDTKRISIVVED